MDELTESNRISSGKIYGIHIGPVLDIAYKGMIPRLLLEG
jgi:hypothetical protein